MEEELNELRPMSKRSKKTSSDEEEHLRVAVHCGPKEEMIAMATIDMDDINTLVCLLVCLCSCKFCSLQRLITYAKILKLFLLFAVFYFFAVNK